MIATRPNGAMMRYRLLDTTRAYALAISVDETERRDLAERHATYYRRWLEQAGAEWPTLSSTKERAPHLSALGNVRAALEWCFADNGKADLGISLAAAAAPVFLALSLLTECRLWSERAIVALGDTASRKSEAMRLQTALALSLMFTGGDSKDACRAFNKSLAISEDLGDAAKLLRTLGQLHMFHQRAGDFNVALGYARRSIAASESLASLDAVALARCQLGISLSYMGDLSGAREELEPTLESAPGATRTGVIFHGFDHYNISSGYLARTLWLQGYPDQAVELGRLTVKNAEQIDHPVTLSVALIWVVTVFLWTGDLQSAEDHTHWLASHAESHSLGPYLAAARSFQAQIDIRRGDTMNGIARLEGCLEALRAVHYELLRTPVNIACIEGLLTLGRLDQGLTRVEEAIGWADKKGDISFMPELLRLKARLLLASPSDNGDAESCFGQSLAWSRRQGARSWELRTAVDLATLWATQGQPKKSRAVLEPIFDGFSEGFHTEDMHAAKRLVATLR
jgi:tetratricopeptide (TPR) repeat protein